ncbi:MAG: energy-coupling factor transporter transmembrane component T [Spirochaetales bacterium]|uniref:Energy-coupling factor transporter transmembrane component T n=1 Tax=Candidatus Thalassospirochaeta sargassi TaxID=3119039 RepID=A0AAJ1IDH5_9SPIO|nr:energy-coupling factor transporter transmembrane component T [Spirochaetales bacterium]
MKDYRIFEYTGGPGILHRTGPGPKLAGMIVLCILLAILQPLFLPIPAALTIILLLNSGKQVLIQFASMWRLFVFFALSGAVKGLTHSSVFAGLFFTLRLILMSGVGVLFYSSTRLSRLRLSLSKVTAVLPFKSIKQLPDLIVMALAFLPTIFRTVEEQKTARYSRAFRNRGNIVKTIKLLSLPLLVHMLLKTEDAADAWYSRGYNPEK